MGARREARAARRRRGLTAATLAERLAQEIQGQDAALERVASVVASQLAKRRPARPGSVLLIGPTGVGKTATIEALPAALRDLGYPGARVHRIDCSELADDVHLTRVLGVGPGYVGHDDSTALLDALRRQGVIVLLDEIEKAHRDLHDALLALLDTGTLTDPTGAQVGCAHAIVALTSNLGWSHLADRLGATSAARSRRRCPHLPCAPRRPGPTTRARRAHRRHRRVRGARRRCTPRRGALRRAPARPGVRGRGRRRGSDRARRRARPRRRSGAGARGLYHAARDLLAECVADVAGERAGVTWSIVAGPPPVLVRAF